MEENNQCAELSKAYEEYVKAFRAFKKEKFDFRNKDDRRSALPLKENVDKAYEQISEKWGRASWEWWAEKHEAYSCLMPKNAERKRKYTGVSEISLPDQISGMKILDRERVAVCYDNTIFIHARGADGNYRETSKIKTEFNYGYAMQLLPDGRLACIDVGAGNILIFSGFNIDKPVLSQKIEGAFNDLQSLPGNRFFASSTEGPVLFRLNDQGLFDVETGVDARDSNKMLVLSDQSMLILSPEGELKYYTYQNGQFAFSGTIFEDPLVIDIMECAGKLYCIYRTWDGYQTTLIGEKRDDDNFIFTNPWIVSEFNKVDQFLSKDLHAKLRNGKIKVMGFEDSTPALEVSAGLTNTVIEMAPSGRIFIADGNKILIYDGIKSEK
jgi:hypothetical protein